MGWPDVRFRGLFKDLATHKTAVLQAQFDVTSVAQLCRTRSSSLSLSDTSSSRSPTFRPHGCAVRRTSSSCQAMVISIHSPSTSTYVSPAAIATRTAEQLVHRRTHNSPPLGTASHSMSTLILVCQLRPYPSSTLSTKPERRLHFWAIVSCAHPLCKSRRGGAPHSAPHATWRTRQIKSAVTTASCVAVTVDW
jgi:hypothetical protein